MQVLKSPTRWSEVVPGSRKGGQEGSSSASLLIARKEGKLERKRPRAGQPRHAREAAVGWGVQVLGKHTGNKQDP